MSDKFFNPLRIAYPEKFSNSSTNKKGVSKIRYTAPVGGRLRTACRSSGSKLHRKQPDPVVRPLFGRSGRSPAGAALFPHRAGVSAEGGQFRFGQVSPRRSVMPTVVVRSAVGACRSFRCPGAAVRFSPPPHSCPAPCVPVRMRSCGAVCRPRLPADIPAAAHRCRTSSAERTSFGGPNPASAHFRLRACAFVASVRGGTALRSRPDRGTALPVGEPVSAGPSCRGAVYRGRRREAVRRVFRPSP